MKVTTDIIPQKQQFVGMPKALNYEAICVFAATGFFLDSDTYYKGLEVLKPASHYTLDNTSKKILSRTPYFKWHYTPKERPFKQIVAEFGELFETIIAEQVGAKKVILPLSGGLDSRTQAVALKCLNIQTHSYSYTFANGHDETFYAKNIAKKCGFPFNALTIPKSYLWDTIEDLADINDCYSEFTHPRQMAFKNQYKSMGDVFSLGHWGDVLFDDMHVEDDLSINEQVEVILKKIIVSSGLEFARRLWNSWKLSGDFLEYLKQRIYVLLKAIDIPNANSQIRAFKSLYWAPRWTSVNLSIFESVKPITLPYYDNRMCEFICSVPERYLAARQIQIAYIKTRMPQLAKLTWQEHRPFNLNTYHYNKSPWNLPYRVSNKIARMLRNKPYTQRNWELQFIGKSNDDALKKWLFNNPSLDIFVDVKIREDFYEKFKNENSVFYAHPISMLLTFSLFSKNSK